MKIKSKTKIPSKEKKPSKSNIRTLHKKAWNIWSKWLRKSQADFSGYVSCYTCNKKLQWFEAHAGHWIHNRLDFDPRNIHIQCPGCNTYRNGRLEVYTLNLIDEIGVEQVKELRREATRHPGYTYPELKELHSKYLKLYESLNN
jgi:hypothetical protein